MSVLELGPEHRVAGPGVAAPSPAFWRGKRVLVTGHTGFKGAWLALWLQRLGADVWGLALPPEDDEESLYRRARVGDGMTSRFVHLRNREGVAHAVREAHPEIVFHLAAQALGARALHDPTETWETNMLGAQHLLEALADAPSLQAALLATSGKVYAHDGGGRPHRECHALGGVDPYSASKAACEILAASAARSFFRPRGVRLATARASAVLGGGDFAPDRLAPDCVRAALTGAPVRLRHPHAETHWLHVLDCLCGYLLFAERLAADPHAPDALNIGPSLAPPTPRVDVVRAMLAAFGAEDALELAPEAGDVDRPAPTLDVRMAHRTLGWRERLVGPAAIGATAAWYGAWRAGVDMRLATLDEIERQQTGVGLAMEAAA